MFVAGQTRLEVSFAAACARLVNLTDSGSLVRASKDAYGEGFTGLLRVGPVGPAPSMPKLVTVHVQDLVIRGPAATLPLRWEATGPDGAMFPALDANVTLTETGEQATVMRLDGTYRPPLGALGAGLDAAIMRRVANATIRSFLTRIAIVIAQPSHAAKPEPGTEGPGMSCHDPRPSHLDWPAGLAPPAGERFCLADAQIRGP
jgi:hypothetical protein